MHQSSAPSKPLFDNHHGHLGMGALKHRTHAPQDHNHGFLQGTKPILLQSDCRLAVCGRLNIEPC